MRKFVTLVGVMGALSFAGIGVAGAEPPDHSGACPTSSPAGGGDPSCGKPRPSEPVATCELGPITTAVNNIDFGPLDQAVNDVLCALADNGITI